MTKVLGVVGSPRRGGNTHVLVSRVLEGAEAAGAATETLLLGEMSIGECDGCHACWKGRGCSRGDDMTAAYPKIAESGAIVFGTPVYWYGPTALMKLFIDRFVYFNCPGNREAARGTRAAIAVPFEEEHPETAEPVTEFFERCFAYLEMPLVGRLLVPGVARRGEIADNEAVLTDAYELGRRLAAGDEGVKWKPTTS